MMLFTGASRSKGKGEGEVGEMVRGGQGGEAKLHGNGESQNRSMTGAGDEWIINVFCYHLVLLTD